MRRPGPRAGWAVGLTAFLRGEACVDASELGLEGVVGVHGDGDAADGDGDAGADLEELEAQRTGGGACEAGMVEGVPHAGGEDGGEGGEEEPELVGAGGGGGGARGEEVELLLLDGVLGLAPGAVDTLVDGSGGGGPLRQRGDDEAGVGLAGEVLGLGDDAPGGCA